ncbi:TLR4 interactor with leucine rich repeats [Brachyhypopomus gauderio]|uniref:TLR4 interactor with leucine rich repeats n=1 Tax=Brachyhypopomus gauderio TaxID=698409 RepID=UPI004041DF7D
MGMAKSMFFKRMLWCARALIFLSLRSVGANCPERCDCQLAQHVLCANRGLRAVPQAPGLSAGDVRVLGLAGNFIRNISALDLKRYNSLMRLNLQFNRIRNIHPKAFEKLYKLEELYLGNNLISAMKPETFQPLTKLQILYSNNNDIKELTPESFGSLGSIVKLRLDSNAIKLLKESVFKHIPNLMFLHMESNQLQYIHRNAFSRLTKLQFLNLSNNKQTELRDIFTFSQLTSLVTLLVSGNQITHVGNYVFQNLKKLTKLSLSDNKISRIDSGALKGLSRLKELMIDGNELTEIPAGVLDPLERLEHLDLSDNQISRVDAAAFGHLAHLKVLKLKNNQLTSLSGGIFASNGALFSLDLSGNNWTCDCRMGALKSWMAVARAQGKLLVGVVRCHHPPALEGKNLGHVNDTQLQPGGNHSGFCGSDYQTEPLESRGAGLVQSLVTKQNKPRRGNEEEHRGAVRGGDAAGEDRPPPDRRRTTLRAAQSDSAQARNRTPLLAPVGALTTKAAPTLRDDTVGESMAWYGDENLASARPGALGHQLEQQGVRSVTETDACQFNRDHIMNVSVNGVTHSEVRVCWSATPYSTQVRQTLLFRVLFDRFGHPVRFPRYVYTDGETRAVTLQELRPDSTYIACVESVVGGALCQVAPRDHCVGFVTMALSPVGGAKLQHITVAVLAANALLVMLVGGVWLGRLLRKRLQSRKSGHVPIRHMYSTRRPFRSTMATTCVSSEFSGYQSGRPLAEEGDLIQFPGDRFFDSCLTRRDNDVMTPSFSD